MKPTKQQPTMPRARPAFALSSLLPSRLPSLALSLALLAANPAQAADRYWTFIGGCATADWLSTTAGANAQGRFGCWATGLGGLSGQTFPTASDDVFVLAPGATSTLLVNVASASRPAFTAAARDITLHGNSSFAAGLSIDRHALSLRSLLIGAEGLAFLGRFDQSGGSVTVANNLALRAGEVNLSGGTLSAGQIFVRSQTVAARYAQTGGSLITGAIDVRSEFGRDASFQVLAGSAASTSVTLGGALGAGSSAMAVSGPGTSWTNIGATVVGAAAAATLSISNRAQAFTASAEIGNVGGSGAVTVTDLVTRWTVAGALTVGNGGSGVLAVRNGAQVSADRVEINGVGGTVGNTVSNTVNGGAHATLIGARTQLSSRDLSVGSLRNAQLDIADGAAAQSDRGVLGEFSSGAGSVRVIGSGSAWNVGSLFVGMSGSGHIDVIGGALLQSTTASVGRDRISSGSVLLTGGSQWQATNSAATAGSVVVGEGGSGSVTVAAGSRLTTLSTTVGDSMPFNFGTNPGTGSVTLEGVGSLWQTDTLTVGRRGNGSFTAASGSRLVAGNVVVSAVGSPGGLLAANGAGTRIDIAALDVGMGAPGSVVVSDGATFAVGATSLGYYGSGVGIARVEGAGSTWTSTQPLVVGRSGFGSFSVAGGAAASVGDMTIGDVFQGVAGAGSVNVGDAGSRLQVNGPLTVGTLSYGILNITAGGLVASTGLTTVGTNGRVVLDVGTLRSASVAFTDLARLDWRSGTLHITGSAGVALDGQQLPALMDLQAGRSLQVDRTLLLDSSSVLLLSSGNLQAGTLRLNGGVLASTGGGAHALQMDGIGNLAAQGQVSARVVGGSYGNNAIVATGPLTMGLLSRSDGFAFGGLLELGTQQVVLLDSDLAGLGAMTTMQSGAQLVTVNGARIDPGSALRGFGSTSVQGRFVNDGLVQAATGQISFFSNVSGNGSFAGDVCFLAGFDPGNAPGNRTAQVGFGGGKISFGQHAVLTLQIDGTTPGSSFDRLIGMGELSFDGTLVLDFGAGFAAAPGTVLSLFDFNSFSGRLDAAHTVVHGYDVALLDLSRLGVDGTLSITAVPEPNAAAMWLAGLGMLGLAMRRLRRLPV